MRKFPEEMVSEDYFRIADDPGVVSVGITHTQEIADT